MTYHKCEKMPIGTIIEKVDTTIMPIVPSLFFKLKKTYEWKMMYSVYGYKQSIEVFYCPYCGQKVEDTK